MSDYCGTARGLQTHENRNEPPCFFCLKFKENPAPKFTASLVKKPRPAQTTKPPRVIAIAEHGTIPGYAAHIARKEKPCDACKQAKADYDRKKYYERRGLPVPDRPSRGTGYRKPCGTYAASSRHIVKGEPMDDACRAARKEYLAKYNKKKRANA